MAEADQSRLGESELEEEGAVGGVIESPEEESQILSQVQLLFTMVSLKKVYKSIQIALYLFLLLHSLSEDCVIFRVSPKKF